MTKNNLCEGCYLWRIYKDKCYYYWEGKPKCMSRCENLEEYEKMLRLRMQFLD